MKRSLFDDLIARGVAAYQGGRFADAAKDFGAALDLRARDAEAASLCGLALVRLGRYDEAGPLLEHAVKREPREVGFRLNRVEWLEATGAYNRAIAELESITRANPRLVRAWEKLGDVCVAGGDLAVARAAYDQAMALNAGGFDVAVKRARSIIALGALDDARTALEAIRAMRQTDPAILRLEVELAIARRDWSVLETLSDALTHSHPNETIGWYGLSRALFEQGRYLQSLDAHRRVIELTGETAENLTAHARIAMHAQRFTVAREMLDSAEALAPELTEMLAAKGLLLTFFGRLDEAKEYCRRCIEGAPDYVPAYTQLSRLAHGRFTDRQMTDLERLSGNAVIEPEHRISAAFALADGRDARGEIGEAFATYRSANELSEALLTIEGRGYDAAASEVRTVRLEALFPGTGRIIEGTDRAPTPIFVVGMPRSGTTLLESIVSAHSRVAAGGERGAMRHILEKYLVATEGGTAPSANTVREWIDGYYGDLPELGAADHFTDKHPLNFEAAGLIAQLFPRATILHVRRNPLETGLSIFRHEFTKFWSFAHRLEDIGHYYGQYARLVAHWERTLGPRFVTFQYEELATDFERVAPRLIAACGFTWEPQCLTFQQAERAISTFSAVQARERVSLRNGKAEAYREHLQRLVDALTAANVDLTTGVWRDAVPVARGSSASRWRSLFKVRR